MKEIMRCDTLRFRLRVYPRIEIESIDWKCIKSLHIHTKFIQLIQWTQTKSRGNLMSRKQNYLYSINTYLYDFHCP